MKANKIPTTKFLLKMNYESPIINRAFANDFNTLNKQLTALSETLERVKKSAGSHTTISSASSLKPSETGRSTSSHKHSSSFSSSSSFSTGDACRQEYFDEAKKVFNGLNNLCQLLSTWAMEQEQQRQILHNSSLRDSRKHYYSLSSNETISRQETIYYDATDLVNVLTDDEDKDDADKISDSDGSSCGDDGNSDANQMWPSSVHHKLKPPQIRWRRGSLPSCAPDTSSVGLWNIMRKAIGKDLSRMTLPVILNEPMGILQKLCEEMEYSDLLDRASQTDDANLRLVYVAAFIVSTYSSNYYRTGRKNFNPLLGETYECIREDKAWRFFAEQVSHHPPISVCCCKSSNFILLQKLQVKINFWGKSMEINPDSLNTLRFSKYNETISWNKCTMCIHNVLSSERWVDHYGDIIVQSSLGHKARISFIQSDHRTRLNNVAGDIIDSTGKVVHRIFGHWHEAVFCGSDQSARCVWQQSAVPENSKRYYGFTRFAIELNELDNNLKEQLPPTDTRFRPDQRFFEDGQIDLAEKEKARLEQLQRSRSGSQCLFIPNWFKAQGGSYLPIACDDDELLYWKKRQENWKGINFLNLW